MSATTVKGKWMAVRNIDKLRSFLTAWDAAGQVDLIPTQDIIDTLDAQRNRIDTLRARLMVQRERMRAIRSALWVVNATALPHYWRKRKLMAALYTTSVGIDQEVD